MSKTLTADQLRVELRRRVDKEFGGNQSAAARAWGVHRANLCNVLKGSKEPFAKLLNGAGYRWALVRA